MSIACAPSAFGCSPSLAVPESTSCSHPVYLSCRWTGLNCSASSATSESKLSTSFLGVQARPAMDVLITEEFLQIPYKRSQRCTRKKSLSILAATDSAGIAPEKDRSDGSLSSIVVPSGVMMAPIMKSGYGAFGAVTLEKSKLDISSKQTRMTPEVQLGGGSGGIGGKIFNGGGGDQDDGGDDDDYFGGEDPDDDGDDGLFRAAVIAELFDRTTVEAVLQEWYRTISDLPRGLYRAVEMGLMSSAQLSRFMAIQTRPNLTRALSRLAPGELSRAFIGRMLGDPAFVQKFAMEQAITVGSATWWEWKKRGARLREEWDLALLNVLSLSVCNAALVWSLSPSRSYGTTASSDLQIFLQKLPRHAFDRSYPLREFDPSKRALSVLVRAAELSLVGSVVGAANSALGRLLVRSRQRRNPSYQPTVPVVAPRTSSQAFAAFAGLSGSLRYQLVYGADRAMQQHLTSLPLAILGTTALRIGNNLLGEPSRLSWLGLDTVGVEMKAFQRRTVQQQQKMTKVAIGNFVVEVPDFLLGKMKKKATVQSSQEGEKPQKKQKRKVRRVLSPASILWAWSEIQKA